MRAGILGLLLVGCSGGIEPSPDGPAGVGGKADGISVPSWLHCRAASAEKGVEVTCRTEQATAPLELSAASLRFTSPDGKTVSLDLNDQKSGTVTLTSFPIHADFNLLALTHDSDAPGSLQSLIFHPLHGSFDFAVDGAEASLQQPFQIWKLLLSGSLAELRVPENMLPYGTGVVDNQGNTSMQVSDETLALPGQTRTFYAVLAPDATELAVQVGLVDPNTGKVPVWSDAVVTHPGAWTLDAGGVHEGGAVMSDPTPTNPPATDPPATDPPATSPPSTTPPSSDPPTTTPPANPRPDCGNDGQLTCDDGTCNPGNTNISSHCYICGGEGQYTCDDGSCNPNFTHINSKCYACGDDGQYTCDDGSCHAGNSSDGSHCHACGSSGC